MSAADKKAGVSPEECTTKQRIIECAADLFACQGFTETSIRELADAVGVNAASLYYHFPSKNAILQAMMEDYLEQVWGDPCNQEALLDLRKNPTPAGIISYMLLSFPTTRRDYYLKVLSVLLQEQHRNPDIRKCVADNFIENEAYVLNVFEVLKDIKVIKDDTDPTFWMNVASSLMYAYSNRTMLGIGDQSESFTGMSLPDLLEELFSLMLVTCKP